MKRVLSVFKWLIVAIIGLFVMLFAYANYSIYSFDTETLPKNHGKVDLELFLSEGNNQPLVVGLGGADGGNSWAGPYAEKQRKRLKENGYAFLSIGYFGSENTPNNLDRISIDGVHKAIIEATKNPNINPNCISVMGVSRGSELALLLGSYYKEYKSVIGIVPGSSVFAAITDAMTTPGYSYNNEPLPFVPVPWSVTPDLLTGNLRGAFEKMILNTKAMEAAAIKVENISGPILLISGNKDEQWPSTEMSEIMIDRLKANNFAFSSQHIALKGGHNEHFKHFDKVITFLNQEFQSQQGCAVNF